MTGLHILAFLKIANSEKRNRKVEFIYIKMSLRHAEEVSSISRFKSYATFD